MTHLRLQLVAVAALAFAQGTRVQAQITSGEIDALVEDEMKKLDVAGVAVGIVKDGKVIHTRGDGVRSIETKARVNEHTNFAIASNTKAFTTAALAMLVDEGKLSWQDRVKKHIPEFKM
jgi:CubicO group peptidase (beta-lactamase class C family)